MKRIILIVLLFNCSCDNDCDECGFGCSEAGDYVEQGRTRICFSHIGETDPDNVGTVDYYRDLELIEYEGNDGYYYTKAVWRLSGQVIDAGYAQDIIENNDIYREHCHRYTDKYITIDDTLGSGQWILSYSVEFEQMYFTPEMQIGTGDGVEIYYSEGMNWGGGDIGFTLFKDKKLAYAMKTGLEYPELPTSMFDGFLRISEGNAYGLVYDESDCGIHRAREIRFEDDWNTPTDIRVGVDDVKQIKVNDVQLNAMNVAHSVIEHNKCDDNFYPVSWVIWKDGEWK
jgi:hypothetical protein